MPASLIDVAGGRTWSQGSADDLLARALRELRSAGAGVQVAAELEALARLVTRRDPRPLCDAPAVRRL